MLAAVVHRPFDLKVCEVPDPVPGEGEVLVRVAACGICGSDVHAYHGEHFRTTYPRILGHEFCGHVAGVGPGVKGFEPGEPVCAETNIPCGSCKLCLGGLPHLCKDIRVIGFNQDGGYAQLVRVPAANLVRVPDGVSMEHAALAQPVGVGYHAIVDQSSIKEGDLVVVIGLGPVGLGALAVAKMVGALAIAVDLQAHKLEVAGQMGAWATINGSEEDPVKKVMELTGGDGASAVIEAAGGSQDATVQMATQMVRPRGEVIIVGTFGKGGARVRMNDLRAKEIVIKGTRGQYGKYSPSIDMVSGAKVTLMPMLTHTVTLDSVGYGIDLMAGKVEGEKVIKVLLKPNS